MRLHVPRGELSPSVLSFFPGRHAPGNVVHHQAFSSEVLNNCCKRFGLSDGMILHLRVRVKRGADSKMGRTWHAPDDFARGYDASKALGDHCVIDEGASAGTRSAGIFRVRRNDNFKPNHFQEAAGLEGFGGDIEISTVIKEFPPPPGASETQRRASRLASFSLKPVLKYTLQKAMAPYVFTLM